ncbi:MAG: threonine synthase [Calditrichaeota bacterium]|nr:MAG: threonine synthase [Calditrichota bacterium]
MNLSSTRFQSPVVSFRQALFAGQAPDGGLYMPQHFPRLPLEKLAAMTDYQEFAACVLNTLLKDEIDPRGIEQIVHAAYPFAPVVAEIKPALYALELFHGPTLSFKDFGAQFMAKTMGYWQQKENRALTILVATSGDTGSAVAKAFHRVDGIRIVLLYPAGKVSPLQEKQFTTLGDNVHALKVEGAFDDCQAWVKRAFREREPAERINLSSANSINIGRLIPQSIYYLWGVLRLLYTFEQVTVCVPSGNFGNLCAGFFAQQMGLPVQKFIAAVNANSVVSEYIETGDFKPRLSMLTLSNAMDVGNPSNWERIQVMFNHDYALIREKMWSTSVDDATTLVTMNAVYREHGYIADPHTAVGLAAAQRYAARWGSSAKQAMLVLSTAHPAKFQETVRQALSMDIPLPSGLQECLAKESQVTPVSTYDQFRDFLWAF